MFILYAKDYNNNNNQVYLTKLLVKYIAILTYDCLKQPKQKAQLYIHCPIITL